MNYASKLTVAIRVRNKSLSALAAFSFFALFITTAFGENSLPDKVSLKKSSGLLSEWKSSPAVSAEYIADGYEGSATIKMNFPAPESTGGLVSKPIPVKPGATYELVFKVRGEGKMGGHFMGYDAAKKQTIKNIHDLGTLSSEWKEYRKHFQINNDTTTFTLNFLMYKTSGWFELADISFELEAIQTAAVPITNPRRMGSKGPVCFWTFDENDSSGITIFDRAGDAHGDLSSGASFVPGRNGRAVRFDGTTGKVVGDFAPVLGQNFTIAAWIKTDYLGDSAHSSVGQHSIYSGNVYGCHYFRVNRDGKLCLIRSDAGAVVGSKGAISPGKWTHVAVVYAEDGKYAFYINGKDAGSGTVKHQPFTNATRYCLGQTNAGGTTRAMKGDLDEVGVYDRVLSADEILALFNSPMPPPAGKAEIEKRRKSTLTLNLSASAANNWFTLGKPVVFSLENGLIDPAISALKGKVFDTSNRVVAEVVTARDSLIKEGWRWNPSVPGYYEIAFSFTADGKEVPLAQKYNLQTTRGTTKIFSRERQNIVVFPPQSGNRPEQFGICADESSAEEAELAAKLGFSFGRIWVEWGYHWDPNLIVEPKRGVFNWSNIDKKLATLNQHGFKDNFATIIGTPAWASPYPERTEVDICMAKYSAWAPVKMKDWTDFIEAIVNRYGNQIHNWEMWNEPHLPTGSLFWRDSTEKYIELVRNGYETVKRLKPDDQVWLGGQGGMRYLPFYREFCRLGGAPFDVLSEHGSWPGASIPSYRKIEAEYKLPSRPWASTEWHAVLYSAMAEPPNEKVVAKKMILDLCQQLQYGAERITLFTMFEHGEKELLPVAFDDGSFQQSYGIFRSRPRHEPRLAAATIRVFLDQINKKLVFGGVCDLANEQRLVWFTDSGNTFSVLWTDGVAGTPDDRIAAALSTATITTGEGYPQTIPISLEPERLYFVKGLPESLLKSLPASDKPLNRELRKPKIAKNVMTGVYNREPLLDEKLNINNPDKIFWNASGWSYIQSASPKPQGFNARYAVSFGAKGLDLVVEVKDPVFCQNEKTRTHWEGDSIQFALDVDGTGAENGQTEFIAALTAKGPVIYKSVAASIGGDLLQRWSPANKSLEFGRAVIERNGDSINYRIHVDATELYPFNFVNDAMIRFSLLVNNNDGKGRTGYLEWSSGIGKAKDPSAYGKLKPGSGTPEPVTQSGDAGKAKPAVDSVKTVMKQADLRGPSGAAKLEPGEGSVKVICTGATKKTLSAVFTRDVEVTPGASYQISFEACGNVIQFYGMMNLPKIGRKDFISNISLDSNWKHCEATVVIPADVRKLSISLFCWQQDGWFEIKDLSMVEIQ